MSDPMPDPMNPENMPPMPTPEALRVASWLIDCGTELKLGGDHEGTIETLKGAIETLQASTGPKPQPLVSYVQEVLESNGHGETVAPCPWPRAEEHIQEALRLWAGRLMLVVGGTGSGKSALAVQWACTALAEGSTVVYISAELDGRELVARMGSLQLRETMGRDAPPWRDLDLHRWSDHHQAERVRSHLVGMAGEDAPLQRLHLVPPAERRNLAAVVPAILEMARTRKVLVVLDYLQRLVPAETEARRQAVGAVSDCAYSLAREGCAVLALSSTARDKYGAFSLAGVMDAPSDALVGAGKETGELEYDAPAVAVLGVEAEQPGQDGRSEWLGVMRVVKNRHGERVRVPLRFVAPVGLWELVEMEKVAEACNTERARARERAGKTKRGATRSPEVDLPHELKLDVRTSAQRIGEVSSLSSLAELQKIEEQNNPRKTVLAAIEKRRLALKSDGEPLDMVDA